MFAGGFITISTLPHLCRAYPAPVMCRLFVFPPLFRLWWECAGCISGYFQRSVGNCDGYNFIESEAQCAAAAAALTLPDLEPSIATSATDVPHGCYWKELNPDGTNRLRSRREHNAAKLWFNPNGDQNDDDTTRVSLCRELQAPCSPVPLLPRTALLLVPAGRILATRYSIAPQTVFVILLHGTSKAATVPMPARCRRSAHRHARRWPRQPTVRRSFQPQPPFQRSFESRAVRSSAASRAAGTASPTSPTTACNSTLPMRLVRSR